MIYICIHREARSSRWFVNILNLYVEVKFLQLEVAGPKNSQLSGRKHTNTSMPDRRLHLSKHFYLDEDLFGTQKSRFIQCLLNKTQLSMNLAGQTSARLVCWEKGFQCTLWNSNLKWWRYRPNHLCLRLFPQFENTDKKYIWGLWIGRIYRWRNIRKRS